MRATVQQRPKTRHLLPPPVGSLSTSDAGGGELPLPAPPAMIWPPSSTGAKTKGGSGGGATAATRVNRYPMALSARRVDVGAPWTSAHLLGRRNCHRPETVRRARRLVFAAEQSASAARRIHVPPSVTPQAKESREMGSSQAKFSFRHPRTPDQFTWFGTYVCVNLLVEPENTIFSSPSRQGARGRNFTATDSGFSFVCGVELFVWIIQYFKRVSARSRGQQ